MNLYLKRSAYALVVLALILVAYILVKPADTEETTNKQSDVQETATTQAKTGLEVGNIPPDIPLIGVNGEQMKLSDLKGKKVFLNFWATWCPPCRGEMPDIEKMHQQYGDDLTIVAISSSEAKATVTTFLKEFPYTFNIYLDEKSEISQIYQLMSIPTSYFIDENGMIQKKEIGSISFDKMESHYKSL